MSRVGSRPIALASSVEVKVVDGRVRYVTALGETDTAGGWRENKRDGGILIDVDSGAIIARGLSMPHSPRVHDGKLWLLNSGTGYFGQLDPATGKFEPVTFCPGYLRGLAFHRHFAIVGLSKPRHNRTFSGLALDEGMAERDAEARCGLLVIDRRSGDIVHWVRIGGVVEELYDVATLQGVTRPMALGFRSDEIRRVLMVGDPQEL